MGGQEVSFAFDLVAASSGCVKVVEEALEACKAMQPSVSRHRLQYALSWTHLS